MNEYCLAGIPFFFFISYDKSYGIVQPISELDPQLFFSIKGKEFGAKRHCNKVKNIKLHQVPITFLQYQKAFLNAMQHIKNGDTYLVNLTFPTKIELDHSLYDIYQNAVAKYKFYWEERFVIYSPESFIQIEHNIISSHPMKGTIDKTIPNAISILLNDEKELAEHYTIVDLIRNDLSKVAKEVEVANFRYIDEIITEDKTLLQTSTQISGKIRSQYIKRYGDLLDAILPAGSITGAPKNKTIQIIKECEIDDRGLYTGVFGMSDGTYLDCGVAIRFIEKIGSDFKYRSGGGITSMSNEQVEYQELKDKIYVPLG
jgi:para-aminobenzoate synthetase component I